MPEPMETDYRTDKAVLWRRTGTDDYGEPVVGDPEEISVRWEWRRSEMTDPAGNVVVVDALVVVNEDIAIGSQLWLGTLDSWTGTGSSGDDTEITEVVARTGVKDVKGRFTRRTLGLSRTKDSPSTE